MNHSQQVVPQLGKSYVQLDIIVIRTITGAPL